MNECDLKRQNCKTGNNVTVAYLNECKGINIDIEYKMKNKIMSYQYPNHFNAKHFNLYTIHLGSTDSSNIRVTLNDTIPTIETNEDGRGFRRDSENSKGGLYETNTDPNSGKKKLLFNCCISVIIRIIIYQLNIN